MMKKTHESKIKPGMKSELNKNSIEMKNEYLNYDEEFDLKKMDIDINVKYLESKKKFLLK